MLKIEAFLRPSALSDVQKALGEVGVSGMSVSEIRGFGRQGGHQESYRGAEYTIDFVPKLKIEIIVADSNKDKVMAAIVNSAKSGKAGDGKVFCSPIEEAVRIRTGETAENAL